MAAKVSWEQYAKLAGYKDEQAFKLHRTILFMFECKKRGLENGEPCYTCEEWAEIAHKAVVWYNELAALTFEDWA